MRILMQGEADVPFSVEVPDNVKELRLFYFGGDDGWYIRADGEKYEAHEVGDTVIPEEDVP